MPHVIILAEDRAAAEARAGVYAPLRGLRITVAPDLAAGSDRSAGSAQAADELILADLSLLPVRDLYGAIRDVAARCRAVLLPPQAALPPDGERIQKLLGRNKMRGFIRNTLFFHPALARMLEVADAGCLGTITHIALTRSVTELACAELPALEALCCRRYLPETEVRAALAAATLASEKLQLRFPAAALAADAAWEICLTGSGGTLTARAPQAGGGSVTLVQHHAPVRSWVVPMEDPGRLCLAAAITCLASQEPLAFLDHKAVAKSLAFLVP